MSKGTLVTQEDVFGIFIDQATTLDKQGTGTNLNVSTAASELLRDEIRQAFTTFNEPNEPALGEGRAAGQPTRTSVW